MVTEKNNIIHDHATYTKTTEDHTLKFLFSFPYHLIWNLSTVTKISMVDVTNNLIN